MKAVDGKIFNTEDTEEHRVKPLVVLLQARGFLPAKPSGRVARFPMALSNMVLSN